MNLQKFQEIWQLIEKQVKNAPEENREKDEGIFRKQDLESLLQKVRSHKTLKYLKDEHIIVLRKDLEPLWSVNKFEKAIKNVGILDFLTTPFMLEIIVQVLPNMTKQYKGSIEIKNLFIQNYLKIIKKQKLSQQLTKIDVQEQDFQNQKERNKSYQNLDNDDFQNLDKNDYEKIKLDNPEKDRQKLNEIIDQLERKHFFSFYSITSVLISKNNSIYVDDIQFVLRWMKLIMLFKHQKCKNQFHKILSLLINTKVEGKRQIPNYESFELDIYQFSQSLALDMTIRDLSQVNYKQKGKLELDSKYNNFKNVDDWPNQYFSDIFFHLIINQFKNFMLQNIFWNYFSFLIVKFHLSPYKKLKKKNKFQFILYTIKLNQTYQKKIKQEYLILLKKNSKILKAQNTLINIVKLSRDEKFKYAASNSIYMLNQLNAQLESQDFSSIQLSDTSISGLSFFNSDLSKTQFEKVKINSCNFNYADLTGVEGKEIICKEKPCFQGHQSEVLIALFSPNGNLIASGGMNKQLILWNVDNYKQMKQLIGHIDNITSVQFASDSTKLISSSDDGAIKLWDISNSQYPQLKVTVQNNDALKQIGLSYDNQILISRNNNSFKLWNMPNLYLNWDTTTIQGQQDDPKIFACSEDESKIAIGKNDSTILIINLKTKKEQKLIGHIGIIKALAFTQKGNFLASACSNFNLLVWDLCSFKLIQVLLYNNQFEINQLSFIQNDKLIIANSKIAQLQSSWKNLKHLKIFQFINFDDICILGQDNYIAILDLNTLQIINSFECEFVVESIEISSDSLKLSTQGNNQLRIWNIQTLQQMIDLKGYQINLHRCQLSQNFEYGVDYNNMIARIFNIKRIAQASNFKFDILLDTKCSRFAFTINLNDEILAYQISKAEVILFDINKREQLDTLKIDQDSFQGFVFSPSENILASAHDNNQPYLNQELVASFSKYQLQDFNYSYDGSLLIILDSTSAIYIWNSFDGDLKYAIDKNYRIEKEITISINNQYISFIDNRQNDKLIIWNLSLMKEEILLKEDTHSLNIVKYFSNKMRLISCNHSSKVIFWNAIEGTIEYQINYTCENISQVCFSKNENLMAWVDCGIIYLWDCSKIEIEMIGCEKLASEILRLNFIGYTQIIILPHQFINLEMIIQLNGQYSQSSFSQNNYT